MAAYGGPGKNYDPWAHAEALGVCVREGRLPALRWGEYRDTQRLIMLAKGMTRRGQRSVLAHEVQHAERRDVSTLFGPLHERQERRARLAAAQLLVSPLEYAVAEALHGPLDAYIADELDVIPEVLADWRMAVHTLRIWV